MIYKTLFLIKNNWLNWIYNFESSILIRKQINIQDPHALLTIIIMLTLINPPLEMLFDPLRPVVFSQFLPLVYLPLVALVSAIQGRHHHRAATTTSQTQGDWQSNKVITQE